MRSYQAEIYFHDHFSECLEWLDYDWQLAEDYIECWNALMDCTEGELKYFINDALEELSKDGFFDLSDSQCEEMMTDRCMGTFKSMYQWVYGRKFKSQDKKP